MFYHFLDTPKYQTEALDHPNLQILSVHYEGVICKMSVKIGEFLQFRLVFYFRFWNFTKGKVFFSSPFLDVAQTLNFIKTWSKF